MLQAKYYPSETKFGKDVIIASVTNSMSAYILVIQIIQNGTRTHITDIYSFIWFLRNIGQIKKIGINSKLQDNKVPNKNRQGEKRDAVDKRKITILCLKQIYMYRYCHDKQLISMFSHLVPR